LNQADSELIKGILKEKFEKASSEDEADFIIINSCGVIEKTERKILKRILQLKKKKKKVVLAGCLGLISKSSLKLVDGAISPQSILKIKKVCEEVLKGKKSFFLSKRKFEKPKFCFLKERDKNSITGLVAISEGCVGECSFCATKIARGALQSYKIEHILKEITLLLSLGFKEIHLTSQDCGCYGLDRGRLELPLLLKEILKIKGDFRVRVGMMNPIFFKKMLKEIIPLFKSEKIYKFFHLPLQSGSDKILRLMKRPYKVKDFEEIVEVINKNFDDFLLSTDILVGFPGETEEDFEKTKEIVQKTKPTIVNITKFSKRKGTPAFKLNDLEDKIKTERSRILFEISKNLNLKRNKKFLGKEFNVLISKKGKNNTFIARPLSFRAVILKKGKLGEEKRVRIVDFSHNFLVGK